MDIVDLVADGEGKLILNNAWLHNDCGDEWAGIEIQAVGKQKGKVIFRGQPIIDNTTIFIKGIENFEQEHLIKKQ